DFSALPRRDRNLARRAFLGPRTEGRRLYGVSDAAAFERHAASRLRTAAVRYPDDPEVSALIRELLDGSAEFARLWNAREVDGEPTVRKTFRHPLVGPVTVNCDALELTDRDQQVVIYTAVPGSSSDQALRLLSVIGTQRMTTPG
ncbi:transcriptional regulator, partial [Streptomyces sp. SID6137]|nr:transcriptional regulator [Streptomyces sp. SID6137]